MIAAAALIAGLSLAPSAAMASDRALIVVAGVGGSPEHRERFTGWAVSLCEAAHLGPRPPRVELLVERPDPEASGVCAPTGRSRREEIAARLSAAREDEELMLVLIGHGSRDPGARFNLPGPDLSPADLAGMLDGYGGEVTVAHLGSASGAFLPALSGPRRVILTATTATQANETRFPKHFVEALTARDGEDDLDADRNKDGVLTALEAFDFARAAVEREYEEAGLLRTEHPLLDDNGDGAGSREPGTDPGADGVLASRTAVLLLEGTAALEAAAAEDNEELRALLERRDELAAQVDVLRATRDAIDEETYLNELEDLLLEIAALNEEISALREPGS